MATIRDLLRDELVIDDIRATDKTGVLREFAGLLQSKGRVRDSGELLRTLMERESLGSTGIGDGVAIPHGKLAFIPDIIVAFGRSSRGIDFQSLDRKPAYLFFLIITPIDKPGDHLKMLARVSRIQTLSSLAPAFEKEGSVFWKGGLTGELAGAAAEYFRIARVTEEALHECERQYDQQQRARAARGGVITTVNVAGSIPKY